MMNYLIQKKYKMKTIFSLLMITMLLACNREVKNNDASDPSPLSFQLTELWSTDTIMQTPESVLFDPEAKVLYVANMHLATEEEDGFISRLSLDGSVLELEWVGGLKAPKGMGIYDGKLYATDEDELAIIDIESATLLEKVEVDGAEFVNDLAISKDGVVYFSDSRVGKLHTYEDGVVSEWITEGLDRPNGVFVEGDIVWLASSGSGDVRKINKESGEMEVIAEGIGAGDGIEFSGIEGYYLVSDWNGEIFMIGQDTVQSLLNTKDLEKNTADFGYDPEEKIVYVPTFFDNRVVAYKLEVK